ncbi:UDP-3-O-glucosamine N-acyltransferase [Abortiporus biennis]|nr:UDP-3-O-glucosamine N-acyltransferase [Abortiporus biennis]
MDFDESTTQFASNEFLAVIIAGFGNELHPLTSDNGDEPCPKALLPIANKPMLDYPLTWLESSGIRDVLLICPSPHRASISHFLGSDSSTSFPSLRIDLQTYEETPDSSVGTCAILRHFASRIQQDFVLLPCDFVPPPSFSLTTLLDKFRTESTYDGCIAAALFYETRKPEKGTNPDEWGPPPSAVPIVWDEKTGTLLYVDSPDDVDKNSDELELSMSVLAKYPRPKLSASFQDSHVYVCRRPVLEILQDKTRFESIREEFIPWLCKSQYHRAKRAKYAQVLSSVSNTFSQKVAREHSTTHLDLSDYQETEETPDDVMASLRVGVVTTRVDAGFTARANTLTSYLELNRHFLSQTAYTLPTDSESRSLIDQKAQISSDSMVGHTTAVGERTSIKKSIIGKHCVVGKYVKIVGCVIFDHCVIADGAKLEGCILGTNTKVGAKAELSKCVTQAGLEVTAGESFKNERIEVSDWTAPHGSSEDDEETESDGHDDDGDESS